MQKHSDPRVSPVGENKVIAFTFLYFSKTTEMLDLAYCWIGHFEFIFLK